MSRSFNRLNRKVHYWIAFASALPLLVIILSGLLLQTKKHWSWVQPATQRGTGSVPVLGFDEILAALRAEPSARVESWDDVDRLDVRPARGLVKVRLESGLEVQIDLGTGEILQTAIRRSDLIESLHDGSFFGGDWVKLGVFLPTGVILLLLWGSGVWLWWVPFARKQARSRSDRPEVDPDPSR